MLKRKEQNSGDRRAEDKAEGRGRVDAQQAPPPCSVGRRGGACGELGEPGEGIRRRYGGAPQSLAGPRPDGAASAAVLAPQKSRHAGGPLAAPLPASPESGGRDGPERVLQRRPVCCCGFRRERRGCSGNERARARARGGYPASRHVVATGSTCPLSPVLVSTPPPRHGWTPAC